jgi:hypothetical protein
MRKTFMFTNNKDKLKDKYVEKVGFR